MCIRDSERTERRARRLSGISEQPGTEGELLIGELREDPELRQLFTKIDWARSGPKEIEAALGETGSTSSSLATVPSSPAAASVERLLGVKSAMQRDGDALIGFQAYGEAQYGNEEINFFRMVVAQGDLLTTELLDHTLDTMVKHADAFEAH